MPVTTRQSNGVTILDVAGKVTIDIGAVQLREAVQGALNGGAKNILLNVKDMTTVDSSGIGEFISSYTGATNRGGALKLLSVPPKLYDTLVITQLLTVFEIYDNEDEAVASFA
ncbi:STAS domain-containing protein [Inquilinus sp.]|jgi:anti-anti-sigma factor|uniref:STAS domain-containing protein n=1 Tax=Inquilinus sp. TaxID=1932117 RepID=UPI003783137A